MISEPQKVPVVGGNIAWFHGMTLGSLYCSFLRRRIGPDGESRRIASVGLRRKVDSMDDNQTHLDGDPCA
jgi:hypothetical protein